MAVYLGEEVSNMTNSKETPPERSEDQTEVAPGEIQDLEDSVAQELLDPVIDEAASGENAPNAMCRMPISSALSVLFRTFCRF